MLAWRDGTILLWKWQGETIGSRYEGHDEIIYWTQTIPHRKRFFCGEVFRCTLKIPVIKAGIRRFYPPGAIHVWKIHDKYHLRDP